MQYDAAIIGADGVYLIASPDELMWFDKNAKMTDSAKLLADITINEDVSGSDATSQKYKWTPIGMDKTKAYTGNFDGNGHTISGLYINNFYGLFGIYLIPAEVGIPLTMLLVVFITNAVNLIDGIDGLASGLSMVALVVFGVVFVYLQLWCYAMLAFVSVGVIIPFFSYNVFGNADMGRKIFMGDTGSLTLGFILSFFVIKYCMYTPDMLLMVKSSPVLISFSVLLVPCLDVVRVVMRRARNKQPLFMPDKTHIHHKFLAMGFSPRRAMVTIQLMSVCFCAFTMVAIHYVNNTLVFVIDIISTR